MLVNDISSPRVESDYSPSVGRWYEKLYKKYRITLCHPYRWNRWFYIDPRATYEDALWILDQRGGLRERLMGVVESGIPDERSDVNWIAYHFGFLRINDVPPSIINVIESIQSGCCDTAITFLKRGDAKKISDLLMHNLPLNAVRKSLNGAGISLKGVPYVPGYFINPLLHIYYISEGVKVVEPPDI